MPRPKSLKKTSGAEERASTSTTVSTLGNGSPEIIAAQPTASETMKAMLKNTTPREPRKPQSVKAESRSNLLPINLEDEIRRLAYLLSERRGFEPGHETEDWVSAEREIRQRYHQQSA